MERQITEGQAMNPAEKISIMQKIVKRTETVGETRATYSNFHFLYNLSTFCGDRIFFYLTGDYVNIIPSNRTYVTELSIINTDGRKR
jgi:hypothetical protein